MKTLFVLILTFAFLAQAEPSSKEQTAQLKYSEEFILNAVLQKKHLSLKSELPLPVVFLSSTTPLKKFQDAIEPQWGFRPDVFTNAYAFKSNEIFLMDDENYYQTHKRCIDDSLAHELVHYVQVKYQNADLADDSLEAEAVDIQTWFRESYCKM
jgi:hypothetical protein